MMGDVCVVSHVCVVCYVASSILQCLKNKLGTRQLPTAELLLDGTCARLVRVSLLLSW